MRSGLWHSAPRRWSLRAPSGRGPAGARLGEVLPPWGGPPFSPLPPPRGTPPAPPPPRISPAASPSSPAPRADSGAPPRSGSTSAARPSRSTSATRARAGAVVAIARRARARGAGRHRGGRRSRGHRPAHARALRPRRHPRQQRGAGALDALRRPHGRGVARGARGQPHRALSPDQGRAPGHEGAAVRPHRQHLVVGRAEW